MARIIIFFIILYFGMRLNSFITTSTCFIRGSIGIPCPLCGMTRALKLFLIGDIQGAFNMHPLFIMPIIIFIIIIIKGFKYIDKYKYRLASLFMSVYIYRMIVMFPTKVPFTFNTYAILPRFISIIASLFENISNWII